MTKSCLGVLCVVAVLSCSSDPPPGAAVTKDVTLPDSPLTRMANVTLLRAGSGFVMAGYESGQIRWGHVALDGTLTEEAGFPMAKPIIGPVFGATKKVVAGDQLIAIAVTSSTTTIGGYDVTATVQTSGAATAAAPVILASLPAGTDPTTVQIAAGSATSGNVGVAAWGIRVRGISPSYLLLPADAVTTAAPSKMFDDADPNKVPSWDCLAAMPGATGLGFSAVSPDAYVAQTSDLHTLEIDEASGGNTSMQYQFIVEIANCQVVAAPGPKGAYVMAMGTSNAIDFAMYYPPVDPSIPGASGTVTTIDPVLSASTFGDPLNMPRLAFVSPAGGGDIAIGLTRAAGPQVFRYGYNAIPHGSPLTLRSEKGQTGPVASWVGLDAVYVTYTDQAKTTPPSVKRYFMRIESPGTLP